MTTSDSKLIEQARAGDTDALSELLRRHGPEVRGAIGLRIARRWQGVLSDDDIMQQTYADALLAIGRFEDRGEGSFRAWLMMLAECNVRDALKMLRAGKRGAGRPHLPFDDQDQHYAALHNTLTGTGRTPSRQAAGREAREALQRAIGQLPPDYRRIVQMYDVEGLPIRLVARALSRSEGAAYMLRARAHDRLRELLGPAAKFFTDAPS